MKTKTNSNTEGFTLIADAPAKAPRPRKFHLKVDNLIHVSDHGLAVEFTDPDLIKWVADITAADNTRLEFRAGKDSQLTVTRRGNVTKTEFAPSRGYRATRIHYYCPATKAQYKVHLSEWEFQFLDASIFGQFGRSTMFHVECKSGASQDVFRKELKGNKAWALLGESGLRAKAYHESKVKPADGDLLARKMTLRTVEANLKASETRDYAVLLNNIKKALAMTVKTRDADLAMLQAALEAKRSEAFTPQHRARLGFGYSYGASKVGFPDTPATWSHPEAKANYTVRMNESATEFILSSGIKCPVSPDEALRWLRGESPAPVTIYGAVRLEECRFHDQDNRPVKMVVCGCHRMNLAALGGEFATLLAPTHKVVMTPAKPALHFGGKNHRKFVSELRRRVVEQSRLTQANYDLARQQLFNQRGVLKKELKNRPAVIEGLKAVVDAAKKEEAASELRHQQVTRQEGFIGISLDHANKLGVAICNALSSIPA
jgi:hypothetical protein